MHSYPQCQSYLTFPRVHSRSKLAFISKYVQLFDIFVREKHLLSPKNTELTFSAVSCVAALLPQRSWDRLPLTLLLWISF